MSVKQSNEKIGSGAYATTLSERMSYGVYFTGQNIFYNLLGMYILVYFTDIKIAASTVAVLLLVVKIWDAVNDPIFGALVDKLKFKSGKFLPWLRVSLFMIPATTILMFAMTPEMPSGLKIAWAAIAYILWDTAYTFCDAPIYGIVTIMTNRLDERTSLMSTGRIFAGLGVILVSALPPVLHNAMNNWLWPIVIMSAMGLLTMIPACVNVKERSRGNADNKEFGLKEMFLCVRDNKYMLIFFSSILALSSVGIAGALGVHIARYILGSESYSAILALAGFAPSAIFAIFMPKLIRKVDKFKIYSAGLAFFVVTSAISCFVPYNNLALFFVMFALRALPSGIISLLKYMFTPDCVEYGKYKSGIDVSGITFSVQTFSAKITGAISTALAAVALTLIGFMEGENVAQAAEFPEKLYLATLIVPAIGAVAALLILHFYRLRDKDVQVLSDCNAGLITKQDAERLLEGRNI
ncbi:MAG: glycoside-pentoside-hexuronide (GPH):cation symporter [Clostridiales bacterium]|nr:glycoside-pentoside-hexuronide (GPH):cation symporter [Clostridiales bacterium]